MLCRPSPVSSDLFSYRDGCFSAEISDLGPGFRFGQAMSHNVGGLTLISERTGQAVVFVISSIERDSDNDIQVWNLIPAPGQKILNGKPALRMVLFND